MAHIRSVSKTLVAMALRDVATFVAPLDFIWYTVKAVQIQQSGNFLSLLRVIRMRGNGRLGPTIV